MICILLAARTSSQAWSEYAAGLLQPQLVVQTSSWSSLLKCLLTDSDFSCHAQNLFQGCGFWRSPSKSTTRRSAVLLPTAANEEQPGRRFPWCPHNGHCRCRRAPPNPQTYDPPGLTQILRMNEIVARSSLLWPLDGLGCRRLATSIPCHYSPSSPERTSSSSALYRLLLPCTQIHIPISPVNLNSRYGCSLAGRAPGARRCHGCGGHDRGAAQV